MPNCYILKTDASELAPWKQQYLRQVTAPLDGMWQALVAAAEHYLIYDDNEQVGYCVVNGHQKLLQYFVNDSYPATNFFGQALRKLKVKHAVVSTCEPCYLAHCQAHSQIAPSVIALMYHVSADANIESPAFPTGSSFRPIGFDELLQAIEFTMAAIEADEDWLKDYYTERLRGKELWGLWQSDRLIATGECRPSRWQPPFADVGMIVAPKYRGQGIATNVLRRLIQVCQELGLRAICSTDYDNKAAQSAIENAGFVKYHEILEFRFEPNVSNR